MSDQPTLLLRQADEARAVVEGWLATLCESNCSAPAVMRASGAVLCDRCWHKMDGGGEKP